MGFYINDRILQFYFRTSSTNSFYFRITMFWNRIYSMVEPILWVHSNQMIWAIVWRISVLSRVNYCVTYLTPCLYSHQSNRSFPILEQANFRSSHGISILEFLIVTVKLKMARKVQKKIWTQFQIFIIFFIFQVMTMENCRVLTTPASKTSWIHVST